MKKITVLLLTILAFGVSYSQNQNEVEIAEGKKRYTENDSIPEIIYTKEKREIKPIIVINGKNCGSEMLAINPIQIESINIKKRKLKIGGKEYYGKIIIETKPNYHPKMISLRDLVEKYTELKNDNLIFSIDGGVINANEKEVFVDEKYIIHIIVIELNRTEKAKDVYFIKILTRTPENLKKANTVVIRIRGSESIMND